jgi:hypothetical protein
MPVEPPHYLVPWTTTCLACGHPLDNDGASEAIDLRGARPGDPKKVILVRGRCAQCNIGYQFDSFNVSGSKYLVTQPLPYLAVSSRTVVTRALVEEVEARLVLQHNSFSKEGEQRGIIQVYDLTHKLVLDPQSLQDAVFMNWVLRYYREKHRLHFAWWHEGVDGMVVLCNNSVRQNGLPSKHHRCTKAGVQHLQHIRSLKKLPEAELQVPKISILIFHDIFHFL